MSKIGICGDVHGRTFWKDVRNHVEDFEKIVFLGDYLSPYKYEEISNKEAIDVFEEVLKFKKGNPDKVVLLMGNHDFSYINSNICECRTDYTNWNKLNGMYFENIKSFDLAWETNIGDKRYFFSHAGVKKGWLKCVAGEWFAWDDIDKLPPADMFNDAFHKRYGSDEDDALHETFEYLIGVYSTYRGWSGWDYGSIVWADIREYGMGPEYDDVIFVCGHTQLGEEPIVREWVMDLDCRKPFVLDTETGKIEEYK